jgi:hypothetical protein
MGSGIGGCLGAEAADPVQDPDEHRRVWTGGMAYPAFLDSADARRELWVANTEEARVPDDLRRRAAAVPGAWRILAVAEDWCGDSAYTLPYVAELADALPGVELRVVGSQEGRGVMAAHPTLDGRIATPTYVLLDDDFQDRGCLSERPPVLQEEFLAREDTLSEDALYDWKYAWYEEDAGRSTVEEMVRVMEAAGAGEHRCVAGEVGAE